MTDRSRARATLAQLSDDELGSRLADLANAVEWPAPTGLAVAVRASIEAGDGLPDAGPRRGWRRVSSLLGRGEIDAGSAAGGRRRWRLRPAIALALIALLILAALAIAVGLGVPGIRITFGPGPTVAPASPAPAPTTPGATLPVSGGTVSSAPPTASHSPGASPPSPGTSVASPAASTEPSLAAGLALGRRVTQAEANAGVDYPILRPTVGSPGPPDEIWLDGAGRQGVVSFVWRAGASGPAAPGTNVGLLLSEFRGTVNPRYLTKAIEPGTTVTPLTMGGEPAYWIAGAPHNLLVDGPDGGVIDQRVRLAGNVLMWTRGDLTLRLETAGGLDEALRIANSVR